jgi:threonine aldolase
MLVDLRSDTVTKPSAAMRRAIADAEVGDDVYAEDPTVRALEEHVAGLFGHQEAVFVPSGTMGNQICLRLVVESAGELLCDADAHVVTYEHGAAADLSGIQSRTWTSRGGIVDPLNVAEMIRPPGWNTVPTAAVAVEQTFNRGGGAVQPLGSLIELRRIVSDGGQLLHCDGARIWNAAVATGTAFETYGRLFDTLSVCLSKGLGAPIGSLVVTDHERAEYARTLRKRLGGGMRQAGVLAAAGLYALQHNIERLADDHRRAAVLSDALEEAKGATLLYPVVTNIVALEVADAPVLAEAARTQGVLISLVSPTRIRLVTHLDIDDAQVDHAISVLRGLLSSAPAAA